MTAKQIAGYLKARRDQRGSTFGGITFNDGYNVPTFGITKAAYDAISRAMSAEYGAFGEPTNLTPAVVKKALKNHLERGGTLQHATKKSPAQLQREIDEALSRAPKGARVHHATMSHPTSTGQGVDAFWDIYEEELVRSIAKNPEEYALGTDEPQEVYARRIRDSFQKLAQERGGLGGINMDSPTWKRLAKRVGVAKFSQGRLKEAYETYKSR